jgi:hypothetical protein
VAALISMISPLPYSADFRPYFTIHDEDFGALAGGQLPDNSNALPRLLGVTNLYFLKAGSCCESGTLGLKILCMFNASTPQRTGGASGETKFDLRWLELGFCASA